MPAMFADRTRHIDASHDKPDELQRALDAPDCQLTLRGSKIIRA